MLGMISTSTSSRILMPQAPGAFHIRLSTHHAGYILSVRDHLGVQHFDIDVQGRPHRYYLADVNAGGGTRHKSLRRLIHHHAKMTFYGCRLRKPYGDGATSYIALVQLIRNMSSDRTTLDDEPASASASSAAASQPVQQSEAQEEEEVEYVTLEQIRNEYAQESECLYETLSEAGVLITHSVNEVHEHACEFSAFLLYVVDQMTV
eukprot:m.230722 g.230722  ORF g.230722 m.230722 type:complete len:205 (+) comp15214_c0_seq69:3554-4168(+)